MSVKYLVLAIISALQLPIQLCDGRAIATFDFDEFYPDERSDYNALYRQHSQYPQPFENRKWPQQPLHLGQVAGLGMQKDGNVVAFHRADREWGYDSFNETDHYQQISQGPIPNDTIVTLDRDTGEILKSRGKNRFYMPHGLTVDKDGNLWVTDVALHQVFKLPPNSDEPTLVLGEAFIPGEDDQHFCKPTDVAVASTGEFFVSDGYCNSRILKYSADGKLLAEWGNTNGRREFLVPHALTLLEKEDLLCVADRENKRILCYSAGLSNLPAGKLLLHIHDRKLGRVFAVASHGNFLYGVTGPTADLPPVGITVDIRTGNIINTWRPMNGFSQPHDMTICPDGIDLYVSEIGPNLITKFKIRK